MSDEEHSESEFYYPEVENEGYTKLFFVSLTKYSPTTFTKSETAKKKLTVS
jgi:hypothetical protein